MYRNRQIVREEIRIRIIPYTYKILKVVTYQYTKELRNYVYHNIGLFSDFCHNLFCNFLPKLDCDIV